MPKAISYSKGSIIYFEGDIDNRVFILQKGAIYSSSKDLETRENVTAIIKTGEFFGVRSAVGHFPREETVTVLEDSVCVALSLQEFENIFCTNKAVMMKMLQVFSSQLRQIHKKIESILKRDNIISQDEGMYAVAQSFFNDNKWQSCLDVATSTLKLFPDNEHKNDLLRMVKTANAHLAKEERNEIYYAEDMKSRLTSQLFDLPAFKRFSKTYKDGQVIIAEFEKGETFYLIQKGTVQLTKCANGKNKNIDILKPGELFGEMAILDNSPRSATCVARGKVDALEFNKANFQVLVTGNPQIALNLLKTFCKRIFDQKRRFKILLITDPQVRIADVFCMFDEITPTANPESKTKKFNLTIADVAQWAGLQLDETTDQVNHFVSSKRLEIIENQMIVDIQEMRRIVDTRANIK